MDEHDGHRTFAGGGGAAFGGAGTDVAGRVHAGNVGLEQVGGVGCSAGEDKAVVVAADGVVEPFGMRQCAKEEKQERVRRSSPLASVTAARRASSPWSAAISVRSRTATPNRSSS